MLVHRWITTCWIPWAICASAWTQRAGSEDQQPICLARDWREVEAGFLQWPVCIETRWDKKATGESMSHTQKTTAEPSSVTVLADNTQVSSPDREAEQELDTDSPLDNANFLSFEDWKKQNLAKAGQSAENVGGNRRAGAAAKERRRPTGINNALDSLGDDGEIELDFGGFGGDPSEATKPSPSWGAHILPGEDGAPQNQHADRNGAGDTAAQGVPAAGGPRSKDAGTTCKERFNYASFDCAATVLKTNPQAKGSAAVLIENKDSYMLNECRAENKFLILELCDDILVDTVVLANYEFFSSIFHTFRVSVSDRYPAKLDQWKELGVYEARNTREVQAFAVTNPLIWARYLRIEFLTHYGHEWFCPLSLIRVHGTTMLEEYKHDGEASRAEEEIAEQAAESVPEANTTAGADDILPPASPLPLYAGNIEIASFVSGACPNLEAAVQLILLGLWDLNTCSVRDASIEPTASAGSAPVPDEASLSTGIRSTGDIAVEDVTSLGTGDTKAPTLDANTQFSAADASAATTSDVAPQNATTEPDSRSSGGSKDEQAVDHMRATTTQPPSANPTTQESFFKSVNKRLQMLETNSSLSLQYIEEQSRILRDAFNKVEKRQLAKTTTFLENLNVTVVNELKQFREQYDQAWRSVALEFEHQRIQYHQEILSINNQLGVLADELVFQKRVAVVQSLMVLICFALVLFTRGTVGGYIEFPSVQNMVSRSYSIRSSSPIFGSAPGSPSSTRQASSYLRKTSHRRQISDDSQGGSLSPTIVYAPPTPTSDDSSLLQETRDPSPLTSTPQLHRSNSSPADLKGENEGEDEESSDGLESESECSNPERPQEKNAATKMTSMDYHRQILQGKLDNQDKIPPIAQPFVSDKAKKTLDLVEEFVEKECIPAEALFSAQLGQGEQRWKTNPTIMEELKAKARKLGLWNMFLPKNHFTQGAGFSNLEYGLMAEYLGKSKVASEATNNAAPDTGNMEVLAKYGNDQQKAQWLAPLLDGKIRSAFLMTEPEIASSDATNIQLDIRREGNEYVLNGSKWWSSGAGDPRCQIYLVMGKTDASNPDTYKQQSVVLVPANASGITIHRMLSVYGYDDAPHGHGHITFKNVRVPLSSMVLGEGRGFEIIQGRLGPGRIHHAMRTIGAAERAVDWLIARINDDRKKPFGQTLASHGVIIEWLAKSRIEIDSARLIVLNAAIKIDQGNAKSALKEIAQAKVLVPQAALTVIDRAVQAYGAAGVSQDTPLAYLWAMIRTLRIADGPDEVHLQQLGKRENKVRKDEVVKRLAWQQEASARILSAAGFPKTKSSL
ncbi:hypothetical protein BJY01DRAFT_232417 [Aspergillus pseudoustus]|uniref:SUN domain-containing protein n=1 Tax=Aspergillus pseudoustus TaxID=1810923 RepID=A0ABR4KKW7_9EURO